MSVFLKVALKILSKHEKRQVDSGYYLRFYKFFSIEFLLPSYFYQVFSPGANAFEMHMHSRCVALLEAHEKAPLGTEERDSWNSFVLSWALVGNINPSYSEFVASTTGSQTSASRGYSRHWATSGVQ